MKVIANCTRFVPDGQLLRGVPVPVEVEANRVIHTGSRNGYKFGLTPESQRLLDDMRARGEIEWTDDLPHCWKKDHQGLRIPVLKGGQQVGLIAGKCGPIVKANYKNDESAQGAAAQKGGA